MKSKILSLILGLTIYFQPVWAEEDYSCQFSYITIENGLAQNVVTRIYRDSHSFLWISTSNGLDRYDGYEFKHYSTRNTLYHLKNDNVSAVAQDNNDCLWVATEGGVDIISLSTGRVISGEIFDGMNYSFINNPVNALYKDNAGNIWIGTELQLFVVLFTPDHNIQKIVLLEERLDIKAIFESNNRMWIGHVGGLICYSKKNRTEFVRTSVPEALSGVSMQVNCFYEHNNNLWIGTTAGAYCYHYITCQLDNYRHNDWGNGASLSLNHVSDIIADKEGRIWIATYRGLNILNLQTNKISYLFESASGGEDYLNCNFVSSLLIHDNGSIYVGTEKGGVNILRKKEINFKNVSNDKDRYNSLSPNPVNAIFEDSDGILWIGNVEGGISKRINGNDNFSHIHSKSGDSNSLSYNSVSVICEDHRQNLWFGTWGGGLNKLEKRHKNNPVFTRYASIPYKDVKENLFVAAIVNDTLNNGLWIGTPLGLSFLDYASNAFYAVAPQDVDIRFVNQLIIDDEQRLWIGTGRGLYVFDLRKTQVKHSQWTYMYWANILHKNNKAPVTKINAVYQSKNGTLWLGSANDGLFQVIENDRNEFDFINYGLEAGLPDYCIYSILEDNLGQLWMSTNLGLSVFNPTYGKAKSYSVKDGLATNQFYWAASCATKDGQLFFGHIKGLTHFYPIMFSEQNYSGIVHFTRVTILNNEIMPNENGYHTQPDKRSELYLHESDKTFSVEFSSFNYEFPENVKYAYKLQGFEDMWTLGRIARYTNIPAGKYVLSVKCTNENGVWSEEVTNMDITISPYFYKTGWFLILSAFLCAFVIYVLIVYRTRSLQNQTRRLEDTVKKRTEEISNQNKTLVEQKEELIRLTEKIQEVNDDKLAFFTNITHEFKTPITLILGPIERSLKLSSNPKVIEQLNLVKRNSKLLLSLVNQLMDFRRIDSGNIQINYSMNDFSAFFDELLSPFVEIAGAYKISIKKYIRMKNPVFVFDSDNTGKIIGNLLSNAIRFTPAGGTIQIFIAEQGEEAAGNHRLFISVNDTGKGILENDKEHLFDRFFQSKQKPVNTLYGQSGTGIGLFLCKHLVEMMGGEICVKNNPVQGANFRLLIPIRNEQIIESDHECDKKKPEFEPDDPEQETETPVEQRKPTLLVVEDSKDMLAFIQSILSETFNIIKANNGIEGLNLLKLHMVDLIISDIMMPNMDGFEFCKQVKENFETSHIPVILLTAKSSTDARIEGYNVGADGYISKPFDSELLEARINNILEARQRIQSKFLLKMDSSVLNIAKDSEDKRFLDKAIGILKDNYTDSEFDIFKFTQEMGVSRSLLHNKLISLIGLSASKFIRNYRLNTARELLDMNRKNKSMNISEIAYTVGFSDPKYFTRCFVHLFGVTPGSILEAGKKDTNP